MVVSPPYIPLVTTSWHSILDSTMSPQVIAAAAEACAMPAVGLADVDSLSGMVAFHKAARAKGVHPVVGARVRLTGFGESPVRCALLVQNAAGYRNLCRLLTRGATRDHIATLADGLICLYLPGNPASQTVLSAVRELFERSFALALSVQTEEARRSAKSYIEAGRRMMAPLVTVAESHYLTPEDRELYDVLASMRTLTMLKQPHPDKLSADGAFHFHTQQEMQRAFAHLPQALANTERIAERCQFEPPLGDLHFPDFPAPAGADHMLMLRQLCEAGMARRYGTPKREAWERLERELKTIAETGYQDYFLIFSDIVRWANEHGIETLARGSAAGSLVCYALGISNVCPFRFGLCFERFLNKERMSFAKLADIDLDLPWDKRDEVVAYAFDKYGGDKPHALGGRVAMIGALNTFQGRSAVADIAKVYGVPEREVRRFTEYLPSFVGDPLAVLDRIPECKDLPIAQEPYASALKMAWRVDGVPRHRMMHPCGLVISHTPVEDRMPLFLSAKGLPTTQYAMDDVEELGLLKMDLLGQAGLSVLRDAMANVRTSRGVEVKVEDADWEDGETWEAIATGNARGVFHIESPAMTGLLVMSNCRDIDCLTAVESIIRPGAANEGKKRAFARRHQGLEPVDYAHPSLEPLLADTYGLMAYEEHILLVANGFAGVPWGRADLLRRALVKNKDKSKIAEYGAEFRACAARMGRKPEEIEAVWKLLEDFAGYMFNKAHSAAYAVEAFQGAWMKTRYPVEFLASVLSNQRGFYAPILYVLETLRCGGRFTVPDVHLSGERCVVKDGMVRLPLTFVKGLREETVQRIHERRPFEDVGDFFRRVEPTRAEWVALLKVGALGSFDEPRARLFWRLARLEAVHARARVSRHEGLLLNPEEAAGEAAGAREHLDEMSNSPNPAWEHELLGFPVSVHPLDYYGPGVDWTRYVPAAEAQRRLDEEVEVCGLIVCDRHHTTERGPMKFLTLADRSGFVEVALFSDAYRRFGHATTQPVVAVRGIVDAFDNRKGGVINGATVRAPAKVRALGRAG